MPTVTDPLHPDRVRELLDELQARVSSVAGREAALNRAHAASLLAAKRQLTSRKESVSSGREQKLAAIMAQNAICSVAGSRARMISATLAGS